MKKALCVGINKFRYFGGNNLNGCVNDAHDMARFLEPVCGEKNITVLTDDDATRESIIYYLRNMVAMALDGGIERIYFSMSSHGSNIADAGGDERDGYDEVFVCHDTTPTFDHIIVDDDLYDYLRVCPCPAEVFLDTCHSGTGLRIVPDGVRRRFLQNPLVPFGDAAGLRRAKGASVRGANTTLWAACKDSEYAADALIEGKYNGAFTRHLIDAMNAKPENPIRQLLFCRFKTALKNNYGQTPQLETSFCGRFKRMF